MTITVDPEETLLDNPSVELGVYNGMTKTVIRIRKKGTIKFKNKHSTSTLTIASPNNPPPFLVPGVSGPQSQFVVPPKDHLTVTISGAYDVGSHFTYTAQVGDSTPEDPVVIVDRR